MDAEQANIYYGILSGEIPLQAIDQDELSIARICDAGTVPVGPGASPPSVMITFPAFFIAELEETVRGTLLQTPNDPAAGTAMVKAGAPSWLTYDAQRETYVCDARKLHDTVWLLLRRFSATLTASTGYRLK